jgi:hypothetical protein
MRLKNLSEEQMGCGSLVKLMKDPIISIYKEDI